MMKSSFKRFAGYYAVFAGAAGFLYSVAFIILKNNLLSAYSCCLAIFLPLQR